MTKNMCTDIFLKNFSESVAKNEFVLQKGVNKTPILILFILILSCPKSFSQPTLITQLGHTDKVTAMAASLDNKYLLSGGRDGSVILWDIESEKVLKQFSNFENGVSSVAISNNNKYAIAASDSTVWLWVTDTGAKIQQLYHSDYVETVAFSKDNRFVVTAGFDHIIRLWDIEKGQVLKRFKGHTRIVNSVEFSHDSNFLLTTSNDGTARLWDTVSGRELQLYEHSEGEILKAVFSKNGQNVFTINNNGDVWVWNIQTGNTLSRRYEIGAAFASYDRDSILEFSNDRQQVLIGSTVRATLWDLASEKAIGTFGWADLRAEPKISPDGRYVVSPIDYNTLQIWDAITGRKLNKINGYASEELSGVFSPSGQYFLTRGENYELLLWDIAIGREIQRFIGHNAFAHTITFSHQGKYLLTGSRDENVRLWNVDTGQLIYQLDTRALYARFSPDLRYILTHYRGSSVTLWDFATGKEHDYLLHDHQVHTALFSPDGKYILTAGEDAIARLWDVNTSSVVHELDHNQSWVRSCRFSKNGKYILTVSNDGIAHLWDTTSGKILQTITVHKPNKIDDAVFTPDDENIVVTDAFGELRLWDIVNRKFIRAFGWHVIGGIQPTVTEKGRDVFVARYDGTGSLWDIKTGQEKISFGYSSRQRITESIFLSNDEYLITGADDGTISKWEVNNGNKIKTLKGWSAPVGNVKISSDGEYFLTRTKDNKIHQWDASKGERIRRFGIDYNGLDSPILSHDGKYMITANLSGIIRLWNLRTGQVMMAIQHPSVSKIAISPNSRLIATAGRDGTARIWDTVSGDQIHQFEGVKVEYVNRGMQPGDINSVVFSPSGKYLLIGGDDNIARLMDIETGREVQRYEGHTLSLTSVSISRDESLVVTTSKDGTIRIWNLNSGEQLLFIEAEAEAQWAVLSQDGQHLITSNSRYGVWLVDLTWGWSKQIMANSRFSENTAKFWGLHAYIADRDGNLHVWSKNGEKLYDFEGHLNSINELVIFPTNAKYLVTSSEDGTTRIWDKGTQKELCQLISLNDGNWAVVTPEGRFDTNSLEEIQGLHWIFSDDPLTPLPIEIFMRDYYEPNLLPRLLTGDELPTIRDLSKLNRVQPIVEINSIKPVPEHQGQVEVSISVQSQSRIFRRGSNEELVRSGVYDLRLFRDGRLVAQLPRPHDEYFESSTIDESFESWRKSARIKLDNEGKAEITFIVSLAQSSDINNVVFSAYAFNTDRIKSTSVYKTYHIPKSNNVERSKAYLLNIGVTTTTDPYWSLDFAKEDALLISDKLSEALEQSGKYSEVIPVNVVNPVLGPFSDAKEKTFIPPTNANISTVLKLLAGEDIDPSKLVDIPDPIENKLHEAQPQDLVLLSISAHGLTDPNDGMFYILPSDIGNGSGGKLTDSLKEHAISSEELSIWLRDIDAQIVLILGTCYSESGVTGGGYKPGPFGDRGLGQISYDKGAPVLVSSQSEAWEVSGNGLLAYALAEEGISQNEAFSLDGRLTLMDLLEYTVERVPVLYRERINKEGDIQDPTLFEFKKNNESIVIKSREQQ